MEGIRLYPSNGKSGHCWEPRLRLKSVRIFTRYILSEVLSHAAIGVSLFTFVIFMRLLDRILEMVVRNSAPLPSVAEIFFLTLPNAFTITLPMGVLVGILIGFSRLAADSEITAMRACGIGSGRFLRIISIFTIVAWVLAVVNSVWIAPASAAALDRLQDRLKTSQASFEVQPRVFYEDFKNLVLYVQDVHGSSGAAVWKGIFLADITDPSDPKITIAQSGIVTNEGQDRIRLHLVNGSQQETPPHDPEQYSISTFAETDLPVAVPPSNSQQRELVPVAAMSTAQLLWRADHPEKTPPPRPGVPIDDPKVKSRWYRVEFHRRLALPTSCLVLALVGIPLGLSSKKGGKSTGFVLTILLVFTYYLISLMGISFGRGGKMPPGLGVWMSDIFFLLAGLVLLWRVDQQPIDIGSLRGWWGRLKESLQNSSRRSLRLSSKAGAGGAFERSSSRRRIFSARFPLILDDMVLRDFTLYLVLIMMTFLMLTLVFTFFELLSDIVRNKVPLTLVADYLVNVTPSMIYMMTPLSVLLAVLITFGLMQKSSELTAIKASGISIYRMIVPVILISALLAAGLFVFDQLYIPYANKRQETLRNTIKGKPAQTYLRPDRKWIFGEHDDMFYYEFYDPDQNRFANISLFFFEPKTFQLKGRAFAARAHWSDTLGKWVFEQGWSRTFRGAAIEDYSRFDVRTFPGVSERPTYFKKEVKQSSEMNYQELRHYIGDLQQSGFDVVRLKVQLQKKFAFPLITLIMAILAVPYAMSQGRRGALTGVAVAIGVAVSYFIVSGLFEAMGNANQLPAALAAWAPDMIFALAGGYLLLKVPT
jgi:LPS export ABC transporter permease LptF/LPS export ABC transporter permease LptG